jgi:hypothetical protein
MLLWLLSPFGSERSTQSKSILATQFAICQGTSRATASADQWPARIGANPVSGLMGWGFGQTCLWHFMTIIWKVQWTSLSYLYLSLECTACCVSCQSMAAFLPNIVNWHSPLYSPLPGFPQSLRLLTSDWPMISVDFSCLLLKPPVNRSYKWTNLKWTIVDKLSVK